MCNLTSVLLKGPGLKGFGCYPNAILTVYVNRKPGAFIFLGARKRFFELDSAGPPSTSSSGRIKVPMRAADRW